MGIPERRSYPRLDTAVPIVIDIELHGFDDRDARFQASGQTVNMSRGGLLALVDHEVQSGVRCLAHFPSAAGHLGRTMVYGVVRRSTPAGDGYEVAVIFDTPLLQLAAEDLGERTGGS